MKNDIRNYVLILGGDLGGGATGEWDGAGGGVGLAFCIVAVHDRVRVNESTSEIILLI